MTGMQQVLWEVYPAGCSFCSGVQLVRDAEVKCVLKMNR